MKHRKSQLNLNLSKVVCVVSQAAKILTAIIYHKHTPLCLSLPLVLFHITVNCCDGDAGTGVCMYLC